MKFVSKFKEITITDYGKKGLAGIIEIVINKPLKKYTIRKFENENFINDWRGFLFS